MSQTLDASVATAAARPYAEPLFLGQLELTVPEPLILRFADRFVEALGHEWTPDVLEWGSVEAVMTTVDVSGKPRTLSLVMRNNHPVGGASKLSALMRPAANGYEFLNAKFTVIMALAVSEDADGEPVYAEARREVFYLEEPTEITPTSLALSMSDKTLLIENKCKLLRIDRSTFRDASPSAIGERIPVYFGVVPGAPIYWVQGGGQSRLSTPLPAAGAVTILVNEGDTFPEAEMFNVQIEQEVIRCNGRTGAALNIFARAQAGTRAALHPADAGCYELRQGAAAYKGVVAENLGEMLSDSVELLHRTPTNVRFAQGSPAGMQVNRDDRTLVPGRSFVTVSMPGFTKLPLNPTPAPAPKPGQSPFNVTKTASNAPRSKGQWSTGQAGAAVTVHATMPALGVPNATVTSVRYKVRFAITFAGAVGDNWSLRRGMGVLSAAGGTIIAGSPNVPFSGSYTIEWTEGSYGTVTMYLSNAKKIGVFNLAGYIELAIESVEATVSGYTTTATASGAPAKAPEPVGESTADIIWGAASCDIVGLFDNLGTVTGDPGLVALPSDCVKVVVLHVYPGSTLVDIGPSFAVTRARLVDLGIVWSGRIDGAIPFSGLRKKLGEQARSVLSLENGRWEYVFLEQGPTAVATIDSDQALLDGSVVVGKTAMTDVANSLHVFSQPDFRQSSNRKERYKRSKVIEDLAFPIGDTVNERTQKDLELDLIQHPNTADLLGTFWLNEWKRQRVIVRCVAWQNALALDNYDALAITNDPILDDWGSLVYRIVGRRYLLGDDQPARIELVLREANT